MRITRFGRLLRGLAFLLPIVLMAACSTSDASGGPSEDRTLDIIALAAGSAVLITIGALMYHDNRD